MFGVIIIKRNPGHIIKLLFDANITGNNILYSVSYLQQQKTECRITTENYKGKGEIRLVLTGEDGFRPLCWADAN